MVDNKSLMEQVHEYENLTADVLNEDMKMREIFQSNVPRQTEESLEKGTYEEEKSKVPCFVRGKLGHRAAKCYQRKGQDLEQKGQSDVQAHLAEGNEVISVVVIEANLVANKIDWVLDTGASRHFCANKSLVYDFEESTDGECVYMSNSTIAGVMGKGKLIK
ncbi:hypothetical protein KY289_008433 [Solanum tuberosum]|nr:hypothetical protein KY289_008433 [Solanum tuberosum]